MQKKNNNVQKNEDIEKIITEILKEYIQDDSIINALVKEVYSSDFVLKVKECVQDKNIQKQLLIRLKGIYKVLDYILSNAEHIKSNNQVLLNLLAKNKWDTEINAEYDFVHKEYIIKSNLRQILVQKNMTQSDLAKKTDISPATISNIIKYPSKANLFNILKIAYTLNVTIKEIFYLAEQKND